MRLIIASLCILILSSTLTAKEYTSRKFGYTVTIPRGWKLRGKVTAVKMYPVADKSLQIAINARYVRSTVSRKIALRFLARGRKHLKTSTKEFRVVQEPRNTTLGGQPAWSEATTWNDVNDVQQLRLRTVSSASCAKKAVFVVISTKLPARIWKKYRKQVYAIIDSFAFKEEEVVLRTGGADYVPRGYAPTGTQSSGPTQKSSPKTGVAGWGGTLASSNSGGGGSGSGGKGGKGTRPAGKKGKKGKKGATRTERSKDYWDKILSPKFSTNRVLDLYKTRKGWRDDIVDQQVVMDSTSKSTFGLGVGPASTATRTDAARNRALNFFNPAVAK